MQRPVFFSALFILVFVFAANAKSLATVTIGDNTADAYTAKLRAELSGQFTLLDEDLASSAFASFKFATPTNLSVDQAAAAGSAIGCDYFVIINTGVNRRSSFAKPVYFEAYAALFVVETRTGRLIRWLHPRIEAPTEAEALPQLLQTAGETAAAIAKSAHGVTPAEIDDTASIETLPDSPEKGLQPPIPYRRIKPLYTEAAERLSVAATVEILVDIDAAGKILQTKIVRWAGFGLEASVEDAVRKMNWRPAYRNNKPLAMRVLLRYNFKRLEPPPN
ncbi:MAG: energy transducer TonB [Acidobacteria bacterium]|nr:energy transducer TonB [Acidobacteriota bacterium]